MRIMTAFDQQTSEQVREPVLEVGIAFTSDEAKALYREGLCAATSRSAGTDLRAVLAGEALEIAPGERATIPTGVRVQPRTPGYASFLYSRSGLGARDGLTVAQGVGVLDPDYTGEILVVLLNTSKDVRRISRGERIAQLIFQPYARPCYALVEDLQATERGAGGFGHSGR